MIKIKYHPPGTAPATLQPSPTTEGRKPVITLIQYDAETLEEKEYADFSELMAQFDPTKVNWIHIAGLGDVTLLQQLTTHFHIHPLALEDVLNTTQRPKVEHYDDHYFIVSEMIYPDKKNRVVMEQLSLFLGENFVITIREETGRDDFNIVCNRLRSGRGNSRKMKADYLAYAILDTTIDQFFPILETIGESIEEIEEELLSKPSKETLHELYENKRFLIQLRRAAWPQREIINTLIRDDTGLICHGTQVFLRDCYDHSIQIIDILENFRDLSAGLMDVYLSSLGFRTNEIVRILTVISAIFIPLTFIAGLYGMNFDTKYPLNMPELALPYGYILCLGVMVTVALGMIVFFKRKHWL